MHASGRGRSSHRPDSRRHWGWHPLTDEWARRLVDDAGVRPGELVLDIGAGLGALTGPLLEADAHVVAVELHAKRVAKLRVDWSEPATGRLTVVQADAASLRLPRRPFRVVASPPYTISSALLRRLLAPGSRLTSADIVLQRAAARRWAEGRAPGAGRWMRTFALELGRPLPRRAFRPPPRVDSAVLLVRRARRTRGVQ
ncbi:MAG: rRNA adenine N-6-methyltransferase family protein [Nocardioidaceae bacterium]